MNVPYLQSQQSELIETTIAELHREKRMLCEEGLDVAPDPCFQVLNLGRVLGETPTVARHHT